jgi:dihydrofolate reductase
MVGESERGRENPDDAATGARVRIVLVAAMAENGIIGRNQGLPWKIRSDLRHFRERTWGKPVVMGRRTYLAIPPKNRPLPGRTTVVVSRDPQFMARGAVVAPDLQQALSVARADALRRGTGEIVIAGGAEVYRQTWTAADEIALTLVHLRSDGDTMFPTIDPGLWREVERTEQPMGPGDEAGFAIVRYRRCKTLEARQR